MTLRKLEGWTEFATTSPWSGGTGPNTLWTLLGWGALIGSGFNNIAISVGLLRPSAPALQIQGNTGVAWQFGANLTTSVVGFRTQPSTGVIFQVWADDLQVTIKLDGLGFVSAYRGFVALLGTSASATTLLDGNSHYIEVYTTIDPAAGVVKVAVDGVTVLNLTAQNTQRTSLNYGTSAIWYAGNIGGSGELISGAITSLGDIYLFDGAGSTNKDVVGDVQVAVQAPSGAGTHTDFSATGAATNWQAVSDRPPDLDTSYVQSPTVGAKDSYTVNAAGSLDHGGGAYGTVSAIYGTFECVLATKTDTAARGLKALVRSGSTEATGTEDLLAFGPSEIWSIATLVEETDPNTGAAWTLSALNAREIGETVSS